MTTVWTAGSLGGTLSKCLADAGHFYHLDSFISTSKKATMEDTRFSFFLDSGAFSAWSKGAVIDIDEYAEFIKANAEHLDVYANLDSIAGSPGIVATPAEKNAAAEVSWQNFLYLTQHHGIPNVLPVFHYGEDLQFLYRMLNHGCTYIGLGGMVGTNKRTRQLWLDRIWEQHLTNPDGTPKLKVHGFGMTAVDHIFRYPWHSVDSTSWLQATANGAVLLPQRVDGRFVFDRSPLTVSVSDSSPGATQDGKHIDSLPSSLVEACNDWLELCGKTLEDVRSHYSHRGVVNVMFFKCVSESKAQHKLDKQRPRKTTFWNDSDQGISGG